MLWNLFTGRYTVQYCAVVCRVVPEFYFAEDSNVTFCTEMYEGCRVSELCFQI